MSVIQKIDNIEIEDNTLVRVCVAGNTIEVKWLQHLNTKATVRKINDDLYEKVSTGEVFEYDRSEHDGNRTDNIGNVRRSLTDLRRIINYNVTDINKVRWITLTYAENMTDTKRLYSDTEKFMKRFRYYCEKHGFGHIEYINVIEPQGRGAWHCHLIPIFENTAPFIPNDELAKLWTHGFVSVKALSCDIDNIGAYLSAYLTDMSFEDAQKNGMVPTLCTENNIDGDGVKEINGKKYLKGFRMRLYPTKVNIYRCSRGIKKPPIKTMTEGECTNIRGSAKLTYERTIAVQDDDFSNIVNTRYYNTSR